MQGLFIIKKQYILFILLTEYKNIWSSQYTKEKHLRKIQYPIQAKTLNKFEIEINSLDLIKDTN